MKELIYGIEYASLYFLLPPLLRSMDERERETLKQKKELFLIAATTAVDVPCTHIVLSRKC